MKTRWVALAKWSLAVLVIAFAGHALYRSLQPLDWGSLKVDPLWLLVATALYPFSAACMAMGYRQSSRALGGVPSVRRCFAAAAVPQLMKYVPGKVAAVAGAALYLKGPGLPIEKAVATVLLSLIASTAAGMVLLIGPGGFTLVQPQQTVIVLGAAVLVLAAIIALHPRLTAWMLNLALRIARRPPLAFRPNGWDMARLLAWQMVCWGVLGLAYGALAASLTEVKLSQVLAVASAIGASQVLGFFAVFAPSGLGVREWVLLLLLGPIIGEQNASLLAMVGRAWQTLMEVITAVAVLAILRLRKNAQGAGSPPEGVPHTLK